MDRPFTEAQEARIREITAQSVEDDLERFFADKGKTLKGFLITAATIVGALTVIFGGFKAILGWLGFSYIVK